MRQKKKSTKFNYALIGLFLSATSCTGDISINNPQVSSAQGKIKAETKLISDINQMNIVSANNEAKTDKNIKQPCSGGEISKISNSDNMSFGLKYVETMSDVIYNDEAYRLAFSGEVNTMVSNNGGTYKHYLDWGYQEACNG